MLFLVHLELMALFTIRSVDNTAVSPDRRIGGTSSCSTSSFLTERLAVGTVNDVAGEGVSSVNSAVRKVDSDSSLNDNFIDFSVEEVGGKGNFANLVAGVIDDRPNKIFVSHCYSPFRLLTHLLGVLHRVESFLRLGSGFRSGSFSSLSLDLGDSLLGVIDNR